MGELIFVTGGVRSGKSSLALKIAEEHGGETLFLATARVADEEMMERIKRHRAERPAHWRTVEATRGALGDCVQEKGEVLVLDCLTLYISRRMMENAASEKVFEEVREAINKIRTNFKLGIIISNEVGWGVIPDNPLGRQFEDVLGRVNQLVALLSDQVLLVVSGVNLKLK